MSINSVSTNLCTNSISINTYLSMDNNPLPINSDKDDQKSLQAN